MVLGLETREPYCNPSSCPRIKKAPSIWNQGAVLELSEEGLGGLRSPGYRCQMVSFTCRSGEESHLLASDTGLFDFIHAVPDLNTPRGGEISGCKSPVISWILRITFVDCSISVV